MREFAHPRAGCLLARLAAAVPLLVSILCCQWIYPGSKCGSLIGNCLPLGGSVAGHAITHDQPEVDRVQCREEIYSARLFTSTRALQGPWAVSAAKRGYDGVHG